MTSPVPGRVLGQAIATLVAGGFVLDSVTRNSGCALLAMQRTDEFGAVQRYAFAIADSGNLAAAEIDAATTFARHHGAQLIAVADTAGDLPKVSWDRFLNLFGGPLGSHSPLDADFADHLLVLSRNRLPTGLAGKPDDLFEIYVGAALAFILSGRVVRYGQERLFEIRPDGILLPSSEFRALYDAKAAGAGYTVTADGMRQFATYVNAFGERYKAYLPRLNAFIVISGDFDQGDEALGDRSRELLSQTGVPLSFVRAPALVEMISQAAAFPAARRSIDWRRIFAEPVVDPAMVAREFEAVERDRIIRRA
jgi:hypothetical protein